ncbi:MAG: cyclic nucleotide-binding domain-containing protein [Chloroflexota bacterium]
MLQTIERVTILRRIDLFAETPGYILASVANALEEMQAEAQETIIHEGDLETTMYIVVEGGVSVHSGGQVIVNLGPGETVGELAALDPEPRSASVTASEPSLLFRLDEIALDEIMATRPEVAKGIIKALCRRIRKQGKFSVNTNQ